MNDTEPREDFRKALLQAIADFNAEIGISDEEVIVTMIEETQRRLDRLVGKL